jgi:hypothetical protein
MGYSIDLVSNTGDCCQLSSPQSEGSTYHIGGTCDTSLHITYNYAFFYYHFLDKRKGIRWLYNKRAGDCIKRLEKAVKILGTRQALTKAALDERMKALFRDDEEVDEELSNSVDYWAETPGNAGHALNILLRWAKQFPDATFEGD